MSASNVDTLVFHKDGQMLDDLYFDIASSDISCEYGCSYGLDTSHKLESYWKASEHSFDSCKDIVYYDGTYQCVATTTTAGVQNTNLYGPFIIETKCMYTFTMKH